MTAALSLPPLLAYPERVWPVQGMLDRAGATVAAALFARAATGRAARLKPVLDMIERRAGLLRQMTDAAVKAEARAAGMALRADRAETLVSLARVLAPVCEASARVLGQRPYPPQVLATAACARGMLVEMATGEGKTLAAALAATAIGLTGTPVHILTVNRYLAERDAAFASPLYGFFGLSLGLVTEAVPAEARRAAYRSAVTVAVNKDIAFDYMRDRMAAGGAPGNPRRKLAALRGVAPEHTPLLRGLYHAIVDEADSVLIDEARTPLILSVDIDDLSRQESVFDRALAMCDGLRPGADYARIEGERRSVLLPAGKAVLEAMCRGDAEPWDIAAEREQLIEQALAARHMLIRDEHYLVRDGKAQIVDEFTGRVLPDRTWTDGLQELIERKEGLALSPRRDTRARMTYQRFARRYRRLSGLSGTLHEVAAELWRVYGARVARVAPNRPDRKTLRAPVGHVDETSKWRAIGARVSSLHSQDIPVLIGTRTLGASERASAALTAAGLPHVVLNASQDADEAEIVARAGLPGAITVATNMAGRGTDIHVDAAVVASGGLRVIVSEAHEARRIDRQLIGRCGRQGQPGEAEMHISLDDALLARHAGAVERGVARALIGATGGRSVVWAAQRAQRRSERLHASMRRDLLRSDAWVEEAIAFAGNPE